MRVARKLSLALGIVLCVATGCDDSVNVEDDAGSGNDAGGSDAGRADAGRGDEDAGGRDAGEDGDSGTPASAAPEIARVRWQPAGGCAVASPSDFTITVTATDEDTPSASLTFSGNVTSCTGSLGAATSTIRCPNTGTYHGNVTVRDPEGNTDTASFAFGPCETGSVDF